MRGGMRGRGRGRGGFQGGWDQYGGYGYGYGDYSGYGGSQVAPPNTTYFDSSSQGGYENGYGYGGGYGGDYSGGYVVATAADMAVATEGAMVAVSNNAEEGDKDSNRIRQRWSLKDIPC